MADASAKDLFTDKPLTDRANLMCDLPNVENNDFELEALSAVCEEWSKRIAFLDELFRQWHLDEALVLCCCYIEAIGSWFCRSGPNGGETFAKALLRYGENEVFGRINPWLLLDALGQKSGEARWSVVRGKLAPAFAGLRDGFYPPGEITRACKSALSAEEFAALDDIFWMGTLAGVAYKITKCEDVRSGSITVRGCGAVDFQLFYPALCRIFEKARRLIMAGKLKVY
jgi:hypothetical protein